MRSRRVGTFTLGLVLLLMGVLFLLHLFIPGINYIFIFHLWPCVLIILGIEIIVSLFWKGENVFKYDFAAIVIIFSMAAFSMCMAFMDYIFTCERFGRFIC